MTRHAVFKLARMPLYRLGRWLMHKNYVPGSSAVEHDLRLEVKELRDRLNRAR